MLGTSPEPVPFTLDQHGTARIGGSRLTLDTVITAYKNGASAEQITRQFPPVELADVHFATEYSVDGEWERQVRWTGSRPHHTNE